MKSTIAAVATAALLATASAAPTKRQESAPFFLQLKSANMTLNGVSVGTCHIGAGIESICVYQGDDALFSLNGTTASGLPSGVSDSGILTLPPIQGSSYYQEMGLATAIGSNVAPAIFGLGTVTPVAFSNEEMGYINYYDDAVNPPAYINGGSIITNNWYVCETNFEDYVYQTLNWEYGNSGPTQPSCQAVTVNRVYQ